MSLTIPTVFAALQAARSSGSFSMGGTDFDRLAMGIAQAVVTWGVGQPQNLSLSGTAVGSGGFGTIAPPTTRIIVPPNQGVVLGAMTGAGLSGPTGLSLAAVIANGISSAFTSSAQYSGVSSTVGVGSDTSRFSLSNAASLVGILNGTLTASAGAGLAIGMLSTGIGNGIASMLLQGTGFGAVTGVPTPFAATGVTISMVV